MCTWTRGGPLGLPPPPPPAPESLEGNGPSSFFAQGWEPRVGVCSIVLKPVSCIVQMGKLEEGQGCQAVSVRAGGQVRAPQGSLDSLGRLTTGGQGHVHHPLT